MLERFSSRIHPTKRVGRVHLTRELGAILACRTLDRGPVPSVASLQNSLPKNILY
jgi:hypothetical protein